MKAISPTAEAMRAKPIPSSTPAAGRGAPRRDHTRKSGATTSTPARSPIHQSHQAKATPVAGMTPASHRLPTPTIAATVHAAPPAVTSATTSRNLPSRGGHSTSRTRMAIATTASSVLPTPIAPAVHSGAPVPALTAVAPIVTPGHALRPNRASEATAMPLGAQTAVTELPT